MPACQFSLEHLLKEFKYSPLAELVFGETGEACMCTDDNENFMEIATEYIKILPEGRRPKRGDTVSMSANPFRNNGVFIWTGEKLIDLDTDKDEYGHVPDEFWAGEEFDFDHWKNVIVHNSIVPVRSEFLGKMAIHCREGLKPVEDSDYLSFTFFIRANDWNCRSGMGFIKKEDFTDTVPNYQTDGLPVAELPSVKKLIDEGRYLCTWDIDELERYEIDVDPACVEIYVVFE